MIAICVGLVALSAMLTGFTITCGVWLHSANADQRATVDLLDGQRKLVAEYKSKYDVEFAAHGVTAQRLADEQHLRGIAEAQRNEAMRRVTDLLRAHMNNATEDDIRALTASVFASPLALVQSSQAAADGADPDRLLRPGDEL